MSDIPPSSPEFAPGATAPLVPNGAPGKALSDAAQRALAEAEARRLIAAEQAFDPEQGGPKGLEPTRFGDWERKGLAIDF